MSERARDDLRRTKFRDEYIAERHDEDEETFSVANDNTRLSHDIDVAR